MQHSSKDTSETKNQSKNKSNEAQKDEKAQDSRKSFLKKVGEFLFGRGTIENLQSQNKKDKAKGLLKTAIMITALVAVPMLMTGVLAAFAPILAPIGIGSGLLTAAGVVGGLGTVFIAGKKSQSIGMNSEDRLKDGISNIAAELRKEEITEVKKKHQERNKSSTTKLKLTGAAVAAVVVLSMFPPLAPILGGFKILAMILGAAYTAKVGYERVVSQSKEIEAIKSRPFTKTEFDKVQGKLTAQQKEYIQTKHLENSVKQQINSETKGIHSLDEKSLVETKSAAQDIKDSELSESHLKKSQNLSEEQKKSAREELF